MAYRGEIAICSWWSLNRTGSKVIKENYLDTICIVEILKGALIKRPSQGQPSRSGPGGRWAAGYLNLVPRGKKDRGGGGQASNRKRKPHSIHCARLTAETETAGKQLPQPDYDLLYIGKLEKRAHGSRLEIWTVLIRVELLRPIFAPIRFNWKIAKEMPNIANSASLFLHY